MIKRIPFTLAMLLLILIAWLTGTQAGKLSAAREQASQQGCYYALVAALKAVQKN